STIPNINKPPVNGQFLAVIGNELVGIKPAYPISPPPSITGCIAMTAFTEKVTDFPAGIEIGVLKVNVVAAEGEVTVMVCPAPLRVIVLNRPGRLTLMLAEAMLSVTLD